MKNAGQTVGGSRRPSGSRSTGSRIRRAAKSIAKNTTRRKRLDRDASREGTEAHLVNRGESLPGQSDLSYAPQLCGAAAGAVRRLRIIDFAERSQAASGQLLFAASDSVATKADGRIGVAVGVEICGDKRTDQPRPDCALMIRGVELW